MGKRLEKTAKICAIATIALFGVAQLVPYGRHHANPPVVKEPSWDRTSTRELAVAACFDCHSNETKWPWYSQVAPVSWLVQRDVDEGREALNLSEWDRAQKEAGEAAKTVLEGEMPPASYLMLHRSARLSAEERRRLAEGLTASMRSGLRRDQQPNVVVVLDDEDSRWRLSSSCHSRLR